MRTDSPLRSVPPLAAALALAPLCACEEFATPAELDRPQIIAIRADSPVVPAGERAALECLIAGPGGIIGDAELRWEVVPFAANLKALGQIETGAGTATYVAPPEAAETLAPAVVQLTARVGEVQLVGQKYLAIGGERRSNPRITELRIADQPVVGTTPRQLPADPLLSISVVVDPPLGADGSVAWYATAGQIERYRGTSSTIDTSVGNPAGLLIAVARDGLGGVDWRVAAIEIQR
jgi:hypothetical protein